MTERALASAPTGAHGGDSDAEAREESRESGAGNPAIQLLDALREGDDQRLLRAVGQTTTVAAENMPWGCRGPDEVETSLREVRERFPGLTFESHTRHIGFGLVIEEARVRDLGAAHDGPEADHVPADDAEADLDAVVLDPDAEGSGEPGTALAPYDEDAARQASEPDPTHPMWDNLGPGQRMATLALWQENPWADLGPMPLDMPVRVTVRHDDLQVHEVTFSFPAALWKRALGWEVDPREVSLSQVQAAFIAPPGAGFTTHELAGPTLATPTPEPTGAASVGEQEPVSAEPTRGRRRRWLPMLLVGLLVVATAGWWVVHSESSPAAGADRSTSSTLPAAAPDTGVAVNVSATSAPAQAPLVTRVHSTSAPHRAPTVTLKSDLAFGFDSSSLSPEAKQAVAAVARQVKQAGLSGRIYVDGYTDNLGSASHGTLLSQRRADAVSTYLQSQLLGAPVTIVSAGHGEASPIADNATAAGRKQNRRVTITLPQP